MTALRCTQKLLKAMKTTPSASLAPGTNRLGDWTLDLLHTHPKLMVAISEYDRLKSMVSDSFDSEESIGSDSFDSRLL